MRIPVFAPLNFAVLAWPLQVDGNINLSIFSNGLNTAEFIPECGERANFCRWSVLRGNTRYNS
jgi:hypothetical protein